jgi:Flp pilus assembly protein TadB
MAKKKKRHDTPIDFRISDSEYGGKGPKVPIPINQPNWEYKFSGTDAKPRAYELVLATVLLLAAIALAIFLISESVYTLSPWLIVIFFAGIAIISINSINKRASDHIRKKKNEPANPAKGINRE